MFCIKTLAKAQLRVLFVFVLAATSGTVPFSVRAEDKTITITSQSDFEAGSVGANLDTTAKQRRVEAAANSHD